MLLRTLYSGLFENRTGVFESGQIEIRPRFCHDILYHSIFIPLLRKNIFSKCKKQVPKNFWLYFLCYIEYIGIRRD